MTDSENDRCRVLFLLAGYRASGKTTALRIANTRDDLALFNPSVMSDFKRVRGLPGSPSKNSGFHSLKTLEENCLREHELVGVHYDMLLPLQVAINDRFIQSYSRLTWRQRTPDMMGCLIRESLENGFLYNCIHQKLSEIIRLASGADRIEVSIIQSDWATNKSAWLERAQRSTSLSLEDLQSQPKYSFNLAAFHTDPDLGEELYNFVHRTWYELMDLWGVNYMRVFRSGSCYDCQASPAHAAI